MTFLRPLLLISILVATIVFLATTLGSEPCTNVVPVFLSKLQAADTDSLVTLFGENSCHCQPRGGYIAYLKYESGENDNLAFLFGHNFKSGAMSAKAMPTIEKVRVEHQAWETPESAEIDIPISFDKAVYSPYFLPLDSAYGYTVNEAYLANFCKDPSGDFWKALSLRLRPRVTKGVVAAAVKKSNLNQKPEFMADLFKELLPPEQAKYLKPADAGDIATKDGKEKAAAEFAGMLPRLKRGVLRLYVGRRGRLEHWKVRKGRLKDPVFELADGKELALTTPESALVDLHGPAAEASETATPSASP